jgi:hypothetical protein
MPHHLPGARLGLLAGALSLLALVSCAQAEPELAAQSPDDYCLQHGVAPGNAGFEGCMAGVVASQCAGDDAAAQARCERRLTSR